MKRRGSSGLCAERSDLCAERGDRRSKRKRPCVSVSREISDKENCSEIQVIGRANWQQLEIQNKCALIAISVVFL